MKRKSSAEAMAFALRGAGLEPDPAELRQLAAEALGWQPLEAGAYVRQGGAEPIPAVVHVVGLPDLALAGQDVLLLQG